MSPNEDFSPQNQGNQDLIVELKAKNAELKEELQKSREIILSYELEIGKLTQKVQTLEEALKPAAQAINNLKTQVQEKTAENTELRTKNTELQQKLQTFGETPSYEKEFRLAMQKVQTLENKLSEKEQSFIELKTQLQEKGTKTTNLEAQSQRLVISEEKTRDYKQQVEHLIQKVRMLEQLLTEKDKTLDTLKTMVTESQEKVKAADVLKTEAELAVQELRRENKRLLEEHQQSSEEMKLALVLNQYVQRLLKESEKGKIFLAILELGGSCTIEEIANELEMPPVLISQQLRYFYTQNMVGFDEENRTVWLLEQKEAD
ncbi:MAG: hypothetical protein ACFFC7_20925 [Candidatus Hermodarchaeota archaeon]